MNRLLALLLACCLYALISPCMAQVIGIHGPSIHAPQREQMNDNFGVYMRSASGVEGGLYRNSFSRTSAYLSREFGLAQGGWGSLSLQVGAVYGYQKKCATSVEHHEATYQKATNGYGDYWLEMKKPAYTIRHEECSGFSRGALTPLAGLAYTAPVSFLGVTPRVQFVPPAGKHAAVFHLTLEKTL